jgi:hypothetical protein
LWYTRDQQLAIADAEEGERLARETDQPVYIAIPLVAAAMLAAMRGEQDEAGGGRR